MAITDELLRQLAVLAQGRNPAWTAQPQVVTVPAALLIPGDAALGVNVTDAIVAQVRLVLRRDPARRRGEITVDTIGDGTYRVTINGNPHNYVSGGGETASQILAGLQAAAAGEPNVTVTVEPAGGLFPGEEILLVRGNASTDLTSLASSVPVGPGVLEDLIEADNVIFRLWDRSLNLPTGLETWALINGAGGFVSALGFPFSERLEVSGLARLYVEIMSTDGAVTPLIGPGALE
jgi:hypothetical protein